MKKFMQKKKKDKNWTCSQVYILYHRKFSHCRLTQSSQNTSVNSGNLFSLKFLVLGLSSRANILPHLCGIYLIHMYTLIQFSSVTQSFATLCEPMNCSTPGLPVHHQLPQFTQTHAYRVGDAMQQSHPLLSPFPPTFNLSQHQSLFKWVCSSHQVAKVLEFQLQHQFFQWIFRTDFL